MQLGFGEVRAFLLAGSEGFRRRHSPGSPQLSGERVHQLIEEVGLMKIIVDLAECVKGSKALGVRDDEEVAAEAAPFGGTGDAFSSAPSPTGSTPSA